MPLEIADRQQRVLVDRVLVVEVAHHAPRDRLELREHAAEQAAVVHLRQPRVEPLPRLQQTQQRRAVARLREEVVGAIAIDVLLDAGQRFLGDFGAGVDRRLKRADPRRRDCAPPGSDRESGCRRARVPRFGPTGTGAVLRRPVERSADDPRVAEVVAHQPLDALTRLGARIAQQVRGPLLHLVAEDVLVAARARGAASSARAAGSPPPDRTRAGSAGPRRSSSGSVSIAIVRAAVRSRSAPGASFTSGSS